MIDFPRIKYWQTISQWVIDKMNVIALTQKYLRQQMGSPYLVLVVVVLSIVVVAVVLIEISHCK